MAGRPSRLRTGLPALAWLAFLGPFFFLSYNFANQAAAHRTHVPVLAFSWERYIPFLPWTIIPYWACDVFYALSLPLCRTRREMRVHALRLLAVQVLAVACFLAFPLRCGFPRPTLTGWEGALFSQLRRFDLPFNQAPSLHAALAVILFARYRTHTTGLARLALAAALILVALSTLTTWQHQFIDLPTGVWAGLLVIAAIPEHRATPPRLSLALAWLAGFALCTVAAFTIRGFGWLLLWPAFALSMAAAAFWTGDPVWLGGHFPLLRFLLLPYSAGAWINSRLWTRGQPPRAHLADGVWIGRAPSRSDRRGINSVVGLAAELPIHADARVAMLDLVPPQPRQLEAAVACIVALSARRPTLVCCALGYSRAAITSAAWLIAAGHADSPRDALDQVRRARPQIVVPPYLLHSLEQWTEERALLPATPRLVPARFSMSALLRLLIRALIRPFTRILRSPSPFPPQAIYVSNHTSHLDVPLLLAALPPLTGRRTSPVAAADYWNSGRFRRWVIHSVFRGVLVPRAGSSPTPLDAALQALRAGHSLIFFPEGTRGPGGRLQPLKSGIYRLAQSFPEVPIVPVWIEGANRAMPKGAAIPIPRRCTVTFGDRLHLHPADTHDAFLARVRAALESLRPATP